MWISAFTPAAAAPRLRAVIYLAEFYLPGSATLAHTVSRARAGAEEAARAGAQVRFVQAIFVPQDESCFALYLAFSEQQVVTAGRLAGLVFDRVVSAVCAPMTPSGQDRPAERRPGAR